MKKFMAFIVFNCLFAGANAAPNMVAEINMDNRAGTAAAAKKEATESAMRSGVMQVLARYSDRAVVENLIQGADDIVLQNLVSSTSISNEKSSKTAYSAKFTITLDRAAVEKWYVDNNVPNFLSAADDSVERAVVSIDLTNGLADWAELNRIVRGDGTDYGFQIRSIFRTSASAYVLANKRRKFQALARENGWNVGVRDGIVRIYK